MRYLISSKIGILTVVIKAGGQQTYATQITHAMVYSKIQSNAEQDIFMQLEQPDNSPILTLQSYSCCLSVSNSNTGHFEPMTFIHCIR